MKIKVGIAHQALESLLKISRIKLKPASGFLVSRNINRLRMNADVQSYDAAKMACARLHCVDPKADPNLSFTPEGYRSFVADMEPLATVDVEIDLLRLPPMLLVAMEESLGRLPADKRQEFELTPEELLPLDSLWEEVDLSAVAGVSNAE